MSFSKEFLWGAASAAHQAEGAYLEDGNVTCDHYHRYKEDVAP